MRFSPKNLLLMTGLAAMALSFAACGKKEAKTASDASESTVAGSADSNLPKEPKSYGSVKLGKYEGVEITTHEVSVSDEEVESYIQNMLENSQNLTEVDRPAAEGDVLNIDYEGKKDGVAFDGGTAQGQNLELGSHSFIDGFEEGLIGATKGEKRTLNLTFPAEYHAAELAGQSVTFDVTVNSVQEKSQPELTDEWVAKTTNNAQTTVDAYRAEIKSQLLAQKEKNERNQELTAALDAVMSDSTFEVNEEAKAYEAAVQKERMNKQLSQYGLTLESYLQMTSMTQESYDQQMLEAGENVAKVKLMVDEVAKKEKLKLDDAAYKALEDSYGYSKDMLVSILGQEQVDLQARELQVANFILDKANKVQASETETSASEEAGAETAAAASGAESAAAEAGAESSAAEESPAQP